MLAPDIFNNEMFLRIHYSPLVLVLKKKEFNEYTHLLRWKSTSNTENIAPRYVIYLYAKNSISARTMTPNEAPMYTARSVDGATISKYPTIIAQRSLLHTHLKI